MNAIVLSGNSEFRKSYLDRLIIDSSIPPYSVHTYEGSVKIADVRACIKILSQKLSQNEKRLFIFEGEITQDAQNALLKSLEELREDTYIVFSVDKKEKLLPTILSRCRIISVDSISSPNNEYAQHILEYVKNPNFIASALRLSEQLNITTDEEYESVLIEARRILLESDNPTVQKTLLIFIEKLLAQYPLLKNNVNKKYLLEAVLLRDF